MKAICSALPYEGKTCLIFIKALITDFKTINYHCNNFRTFKLRNYFSLKDVTQLTLRTNYITLVKQKNHLAFPVQELLSGKSEKSAVHKHMFM